MVMPNEYPDYEDRCCDDDYHDDDYEIGLDDTCSECGRLTAGEICDCCGTSDRILS